MLKIRGGNHGRGLWAAPLTILAVASATACGDSATEPPAPAPPDPPRPTTVMVSPATAELAALGATVQLTAEVRDQAGQIMAGTAVSWSSADRSVATVDASGLVRGAGEGVTTITASSGSVRGTAEITVVDADRAVLVALYEATNGSEWLENEGWLSDRPIGQWQGVTTGSDGCVTALHLSAINLVGSIPPELGSLTCLETLDFERNDLAGPIPSELGDLSSLTTLNLGVNELTGRIPPELGDLAGLETLRLRRNDLTGPVPPELSNLRNLRRLGLERNRLTGSIPLAFLELDRVQTLHFGSNDGLCASGSTDFRAWLAELDIYVGPLCDERDKAVLASLYETGGGTAWARSDGWLGDGGLNDWYGIDSDSLGRVVGIDLSNNGMSGRVSSSLARLNGLTSLKVGGNPDLGGPLPLSLSALSLQEFHYADTGLCISPARSFGEWLGAIPSHEGTGTECSDLTDREILALLYEATGGARWTDDEHWLSDRPLDEWKGVTTDPDGGVIYLFLSSNNLTGLVPRELGGLSSLIDLRLESNNLTGPIPPELGGLSSLALLDLRSNDLTGPVPPELGGLSSLTTLYLGSNDLTGPVPPELDGLSSLALLDLGGNDLTGPIPPELGGLSSLIDLRLGSNNLTGPIPPELGDLSNLALLDIAGNDLTGPIPSELGGLSNLTSLNLRSNDLTGPVPSELGNLSGLTWLNLGLNDLTGPIPPELGSLSNLRSLYLDGNHLTEIPPELGDLSSLATVRLHGNNLTGPIPSELGSLSNLRSLHLYRNDLTGPIPAELGSLSGLRHLLLMGNQLTGPIPAELGDLTSLLRLHLTNNPGMSGPLPRSMAALGRLDELLLNGTGLCAPDDADFQEWLSRVQMAQVRRCETAQGSGAYLTQAVQSSAFPVPLVAGEAALLRVFVTASRSTSEGVPPMRATFYVDGTETYVADIPGSEIPIPTNVDEAEGALEKSANAEIPGSVIQPGLEFVVEVDPANELDPGLGVTRRIPETGRAKVRVEAMPTLDVTFVPFVWAAGPDSSIVDIAEAMAADPEGHELLWYTRTLLPVRHLDVKAHEPVLTSTTDVYTLLRETSLVRTLEGGTAKYMGIMPEHVIGGRSGLATIRGFNGFSSATSYVIGHELGHNLSLRHAPCGGAGGPDQAFPHGNGTIGDWGYDFRDGGALVPPQKPDLMGYCGPPRWISGSRMA